MPIYYQNLSMAKQIYIFKRRIMVAMKKKLHKTLTSVVNENRKISVHSINTIGLN